MSSLVLAFIICLGLTPLSKTEAETTLAIALYGDSFLSPVSAALDLVALNHHRIPSGTLWDVQPDSLDALFLAYDVTDDEAVVEWLERFTDTGGKVFTFFVLPERLQKLHGITQGEFTSAAYGGQFAEISSLGTVPHLPPSLFQNSWNIHAVSTASESTRIVASWRDSQRRETEFPAVIVSSVGAHLTHVLLGHDHEGAAWLYSALLGQFFPQVWPQVVRGALTDVAGRSARSGDSTQDRADLITPLEEADAARVASTNLLAQERFGEALQEALRARRLAAVAAARTQAPRVGELRGVWLNEPQRLLGIAQWRTTLDELASAGFNALFVKVEDSRSVDFLRNAMRTGHEAGIEIHIWRRTFNLGGEDASLIGEMRDERRLQRTADGEELQWLCPSHPANVSREIEAMATLLERHDVDGFHLDYIRYASSRSCFDDGCRLRFMAQTGNRPQTWPDDVLSGPLAAKFQTWRREQITRLVRAISLRARNIRPDIKISAAVFSDWSQTRQTLGQDWVQWIDEGLVDFICPMNYTTDADRFDELVRRQVQWVDGRVPLYVGIGVWQIPSVHNILQQMATSRNLGADGFVMFAYDGAFSRNALPVFAQALSMQDVLPPHWGPMVEFIIDGAPYSSEASGTTVYPEGELISVAASAAASSSAPTWTRAALSLRRLDDGLVYELGRHSRRRLHRWLPFLPSSKTDARISTKFTPVSGDFRLVVEGEFKSNRGRKKRFVSRGPLLRVRSRALLDSLERNVSR